MNSNNYKALFLRIIMSILYLIIIPLASFSQDDYVMKFEGKVKGGDGKSMPGATVKILQNGKEVSSITTDSKGAFTTKQFYYGPIYKIVISNGNHTINNFEINSKNYDEERLQAEVTVPIKAELFEKQEGIDYSIIEKKPIEKFSINNITGQITDNADYSNKRRNEIKSYLKKIISDEKNKEKKFIALKKSGDAAFAKKDYGKAIEDWKSALKLKDDDVLAEKLTDAEINYEDILEEKQKEKKMNQLIQEGDEMVSLLKFENAKEKYEAAQSTLPKSKIPKEKLKELENTIKNQGQVKKEKEFKELIERAQIKINSESFEEAKILLNQASQVLPKDKTVSKKLKEIEQKIIDIAKKKAKEEAAAKKKAEEEAAAKKKAEEEALAKKKAEEEAEAKKKAEEEAEAKKKAEEEAAAKKKAEEEALAKKKAEEEALAKKKAEEEALAKKKVEEEALAKKKAEEEALAKKKAEEEALAKKKAEEEALAKKKAEEEALAKKKVEEEALAKKKAEEEALAKKKAEEEALAKKKAEEEALAKKKAEEEALAKKKVEEEALAKKKAEEEALAKKKAEEEALAKKKAEEEALAKKKAEEEALAKKKVEEEALAKKKAEEEAEAKKKAEAIAKLNAEKNAVEKAKLDAEANAKRKAEKEAKEKARLEAQAIAKLNAEKNVAEKAKLDAEANEKRKAEEEAKEKARLEAQAIAKLNAEKNAAEKAKLDAEANEKRKAEEEAKEKARLEAEAIAKLNAAEKAKLDAEANEKRRAEEEAKEKAEILANKEAQEQRKKERERKYNSLLAKGESQFNEKDYTNAKNSYSSALDIKPTESYPKQRINTINSLIKKLNEEKINSIESTDDYFNVDADLYGTEVDMSGNDGTFLLTKIEDNSDQRDYMELRRFIDSSVSNNKKSELKDRDFSQLTYQKFEELKEKIAKETGKNDYGRNGSVASINLYLDAYNEDVKNQSSRDVKNGLTNYEAIGRLQEDYIETNTTLSKRNSGLGAEYQKYEDNISQLMSVKNFDNLKTNDEIFAELEQFKDKLAKETKYKQIAAKENDAQYEEYKDLRTAKNKELSDNEKLSRRSEIEYLNQTVDELQDKKEASIKKTGLQSPIYSKYAESVSNKNRDLQKSSLVKTATTNKEIIELQDKIGEDTKTDQQRVKQFPEDYNDYQDQLAENNKQFAEVNKESQERIHKEIEKIKDNLVDNAITGKEKITKNNQGILEYIDKKKEQEKKKKKKNTEKSLNTDKEITDIKDNLSIQKSDGNKDELALLFPEGVTQKVYQKKNSYGEITSMTVRRVVIKGNKGDDYVHKKTKSGNYYFKNGKSISENTWDLETSGEIVQ